MEISKANNLEEQEPSSILLENGDHLTHNSKLKLQAITVLNLTKCGINNLPDMRQLNLKALILAENALEEVPCWLYTRLGNLEVLDLSYNLIKNFDIDPACRESIVVLKLNNNKMYNLPLWIWTLSCPKLKEVNYSHNYLRIIEPTVELKIKKLAMGTCQVQPCDFTFFKKLKFLEELDLSNNIGKTTPNKLGDIQKLFSGANWKSIRCLNFNNIVIGVLPVNLFYYTRLSELYLENCDLSWIPSEVQYLTELNVINIGKNSIVALGKHICDLPKLKIVIAPFNCISFVHNFVSHLQVLDLYDNRIKEFDGDVNRIDQIDLELNLFDTTTLPNYTIKRDKFRKENYFVRENGKISMSVDDNSDYQYESSDYESIHPEDSANEFYSNIEEEPCWDEEDDIKERNKDNVISRPDISESDDEWCGIDIIEEDVKQMKIDIYDRDEDWVFSDLD